MGYFSNGTEGDIYEEEYCVKCVHYGDDGCSCPILAIHMTYNYDQHKNQEIKSILDRLIPREGIYNQKCSMFIEGSTVEE